MIPIVGGRGRWTELEGSSSPVDENGLRSAIDTDGDEGTREHR